MLSEQCAKLRGKADELRDMGMTETPDLLREAADTIESLRDRLQAAELGSGTCENANADGYGFRFECSECGYSAIVHNCAARLDELPRFCPNCGARIRKAVD